jgi:hypothetical protein
MNRGGIIACRVFLIYSVPLQLLAAWAGDFKSAFIFGTLSMFPGNILATDLVYSIKPLPSVATEIFFFTNLILFYSFGSLLYRIIQDRRERRAKRYKWEQELLRRRDGWS